MHNLAKWYMYCTYMSSTEEVDQKGLSNMRSDIPWRYVEVEQQVEPVSESKTNADRAVAND